MHLHEQDCVSAEPESPDGSYPDHKPPTKTSVCLTAASSSGKRSFSDIDRSPEEFPNRAKKSNACFNRCYELPAETGTSHTGLTGTFSAVQLFDAAEGSGLAGHSFPKRSSPVAVAKSLFFELDEPAEDVFENGAKDLSFTSPRHGNSDICRSLSLDSDGSMHDTSLTVDGHESHKSSRRNCGSPEEDRTSSLAEPQPKTLFPIITKTPKPERFDQTGESYSLGNSLPDLTCAGEPSPLFLRPKNMVAFRSYCSSINRSNASGVSRLSLGSVEAMDVSTAASCQSFSGNSTPIQGRHSSSRSLSQVSQIGSFFSPSRGRELLEDQL